MTTNYVDARTPEEKANEPKSTITYSSAVETPSIEELVEKFNGFIKNWTESNYLDLLDTDENDGEEFRQLLRTTITSLLTSKQIEMIERLKQLDESYEPSNFEEDNYDAGIHSAIYDAQTIIKEVMQG